jgi:hypothetical protein
MKERNLECQRTIDMRPWIDQLYSPILKIPFSWTDAPISTSHETARDSAIPEDHAASANGTVAIHSYGEAPSPWKHEADSHQYVIEYDENGRQTRHMLIHLPRMSVLAQSRSTLQGGQLQPFGTGVWVIRPAALSQLGLHTLGAIIRGP